MPMTYHDNIMMINKNDSVQIIHDDSYVKTIDPKYIYKYLSIKWF